MVKVKICGITNLEDALAAADAGADALGFVFYKKSRRYIGPEKAKAIIIKLPTKIKKVGVFVDAPEKGIRKAAKLCNLDLLQFHGNESVGFCRKFKPYKVIKAFRIKAKIDLAKVSRYKTFAYLFDTFDREKAGGTGKKFNWKLLKELAKIKRPVFLSGGLNKNNVLLAIKMTRPDWVDISTSLESKPGKKDSRKIREFINRVRS